MQLSMRAFGRHREEVCRAETRLRRISMVYLVVATVPRGRGDGCHDSTSSTFVPDANLRDSTAKPSAPGAAIIRDRLDQQDPTELVLI
jgi:hypothetical protein